MVVYTADYSLKDSINRERKRGHLGVYSSLSAIEVDKKKIVKTFPKYHVDIDIYPVRHLFVSAY